MQQSHRMRWLVPAASAAALMLGLAGTAHSVYAQATPAWSVSKPTDNLKSVSISTTEGTWMSVDISPDGAYVVFDMLGDIYRMPAAGGTAELLRGGVAWHMQPTYSPDGKYIAFTSDEGGGDNIWVMKADGSDAVQVTHETFRLLNSPAWSPDGEFLVARKHFTARRSLGAGEIWMYHKSGGQGVMLTKRPNDQKDLGEPAFSADGKWVYYSQDTTPGPVFEYSKDSVSGIYQIKRYHLETGEIETVLSGLGGAIRPVPSPDGKKLAFVSRDDFQSKLYIYDLETGERTEVYGELSRDMQETWAIHGVYPSMGWNKASTELVFYAQGGIHRVNVASKQAQQIPFKVETTKEIQQALRFRQPIEATEFDVKMLRQVTVAPQANEVIYEALGHLYTKPLNSGTPKRLTAQNERFEQFPSYSRDGRLLAYTTWDDQAQGQVIVRNLKSGKETILPTGKGKFVEPTFTPDGKQLVYRKISGGYLTNPKHGLNAGLYVIDLAGGEPKFLSKQGSKPHFGASNDRVYVQGWGAQGPALQSVTLKDGQVKTLYNSSHATEYRVSPNGQYLAFAERFKVHVTPFVERGQPISVSPTDRQFKVHTLSKRAGENIRWTDKSDHLYWSLGPELYSASIENLFDVQAKKPELVADGTFIGFKAKSYIPEQTVAFVGGQIITMEGQEVIDNGVIVVEGNQIKAVGKRGSIEIPSHARVINTEGKTLMPGLIDTHSHGSQGEQQIIPQQNWVMHAELTFGVTTLHDPSNNSQEVFTASELQKTGQIVAPRIFSTGTILYGANGPGFTSHVDSLEDAKFHIERLKKVGAFSVKSYNQPRRDQRQQLIQAARELDMMVVPEGGSLYQHNMSMVVDGHSSLEHSLPVGHIYSDVKQLWKQTEVAYTPTLVVAYGGIWGENYWYAHQDVWTHPKLSKFVPERILKPRAMRREKAPEHHYNHFLIAEGAKALADEGVTVMTGAHGQREGMAHHWEIWMLVQGGMSPHEALAAATIQGARHLGMDHAIGSIAVGKLADIIVIDGDPLSDIHQSDKVSHVMVNGRLFEADSLQEMGPHATSRQPFYFEKVND